MKPVVDSQVNALWNVGLICGIDILLIGVIGASLGGAVIAWTAYASIGATAGLVLLALVSFLFWIVLVAYRAAYQAVQARAAVNLQTDDIARLVVSYQTGQPFESAKPKDGQ